MAKTPDEKARDLFIKMASDARINPYGLVFLIHAEDLHATRMLNTMSFAWMQTLEIQHRYNQGDPMFAEIGYRFSHEILPDYNTDRLYTPKPTGFEEFRNL